MKIKRLFVDIETSPNVVLSWRIGHDIKIDADNLLKERAIICACWKWEGGAVQSATWDGKQNDRDMLSTLLVALNAADEIVMHNGDRFDLPWVKTRCIYHGIPTMPAYKTVDTLQWARRRFHFNSNRLDYIAKFLGIGGKIKTTFALWREVVLNNDRNELAKMVRYCKRDVALLEKVWKRMAEHVPHKTHEGVLSGRPAWTCPACGSENVRVARGARITASGSKRYQMQCLDCGRSYTINEATYRQYQQAKKEAA